MTATVGAITASESSRDVHVDYCRIHLHDTGTRNSVAACNPPLVLLHGGGPGASG